VAARTSDDRQDGRRGCVHGQGRKVHGSKRERPGAEVEWSLPLEPDELARLAELEARRRPIAAHTEIVYARQEDSRLDVDVSRTPRLIFAVERPPFRPDRHSVSAWA
jgi:hypothetical protein